MRGSFEVIELFLDPPHNIPTVTCVTKYPANQKSRARNVLVEYAEE